MLRSDRGDGVVQVEIRGIEVDLAGLDLGEVEQVVDQREQGVARVLHDAEELPLLGRERTVERELGHADDAVHRGADLVTHVREEIALRAIRAVGLVFRGLALDHFLSQIARPLLDETDELALTAARAPDLHLVRRHRRAEARHEREPQKPARLVEVRQQLERERRAGVVPDAVAVGGDDLEGVASAAGDWCSTRCGACRPPATP